MPAEIIPLGARLRQRREELGLTQAEVARELEVARTAYRLWEKDAARPAPDRWRLIAKWLGLSVTAMLLADNLIDEQEAFDATEAAGASGLTDEAWDAASSAAEGDFFSQERAMIADQARAGTISAGQALGLRRVLTRLQDASAAVELDEWHPAQFRKRFPTTRQAPALARAAVTAIAVGIPVDALETAVLLTDELVTNSVVHSHSDWIEVNVTLATDELRVEVADTGEQPIHPRTADAHGGWGLTLVAALATRWGVERHPGGKTIWVELAL
jgi:transcriptional regulator with XRE-family HTH domain/anti-sigma regulatory factor (Ser/Thr protein kinase)